MKFCVGFNWHIIGSGFHECSDESLGFLPSPFSFFVVTFEVTAGFSLLCILSSVCIGNTGLLYCHVCPSLVTGVYREVSNIQVVFEIFSCMLTITNIGMV